MSVTFDFSGKRFVVTGATSGIGRSIALGLCGAGAEVLILGRRTALLESIAAEYPGKIKSASVDITDTAALAEALDAYTTGGEVHGSVHAAGLFRFTPVRAFNETEILKVFQTNVFSAFTIIKHLSTRKSSPGASSHVLVSSASAKRGEKTASAYCASKAALGGLTRAAALELAPRGIRVNAVLPGWVKTEMTQGLDNLYPGGIAAIEANHPLGLGTAADVTAIVLFLLDSASRWITGAEIPIDGGLTLN